MNPFLKQALLLLTNEQTTEFKEAIQLLTALEKTAGVLDYLSDPKLQTAINLLTPIAVTYKTDQILKLLKEVVKEQKKVDPDTGLKRYIS